MHRDLLLANDWPLVHMSRLREREHITKSEGQAISFGIRHTFWSKAAYQKRSLFLVDNMSLGLAMGKGRSSAPAL